MASGVTLKGGRGIPKYIEQLEVSKKIDLAKVRGNLKVSELVQSNKMKGLVVLLLYGSKPAYIMTTASEKIVGVKE